MIPPIQQVNLEADWKLALLKFTGKKEKRKD
jgi:hypothetical protein